MTKTGRVTRTIAALTATFTMAALAACGGAPPSDEGAEAATSGDIVIGGTFPMSGPLASYGALAKGFNAYLRKVDADGGIKGRQVRMESMDDAYDPSRAASNVRSLVQQKDAFVMVTFGGAPVVARDFLEQAKVPQFAFAGLSALSDVATYPHTRAWWPDLELEGKIATTFLHDELGQRNIATLTINNDAGNDLARGVVGNAQGGGYQVGDKLTYEPTDTQVATQLNAVRASGSAAVTLVTGAAEIAMLQYRNQIGVKAPMTIYSGASSIASFLKPAGPAAVGVYAPLWMKDPADPKWAKDPSLDAYRATIAQYGDGANPSDIIVANGYGLAAALVTAMKSADQLTRDGVLKAWDHLPRTQLDVLLPGVEIEGNPTTGRPMQSYQVSRFDGQGWVAVGDVIDRSHLN
jgi:branched-chain amino acid transport system substrate-binding protein